MEAIRYIARVLPDGHLPLPRETRIPKGARFEIILLSLRKEEGVYQRAERLAEKKGFSHLGKKDIERIIHKIRGVG